MKSDKITLAAAWLLLAAAVSLLRYKTALQSDALFLDALASDLFAHGGRWADWKFPRAPSFVPDMLLYFAAYPLLPDAASRIFAVSAAQVFLLAGVCLWFARQLHPQLSRTASTAIVLVLAYITLAAARSDMWLYFYSTNNHIATLLLGLPALVLCLRQVETGSVRTGLALSAVGAMAVVSTGLYTLGVSLPLLALAGGAWLALKGQPALRRRVLHLGGWLLLAQLLAALLNKALIRNVPLEGHTHSRPDTIANALKLFLEATQAAFARDNRLTQALSAGVALAFLFLLARLAQAIRLDGHGLHLECSRRDRVTGIAAFLAVGTPLTLLGAIFSASFVDPYCYRYFMLPVALALLLAIVQLDRSHGPRLQRAGMLLLPLATLALAVGIVRANRLPLHKDDAGKAVAACLEAVERGGFALKAGTADYWYARGASAYLPRHNPIFATYDTLEPFFWVSTIGPVARPGNYPEYQYNFAILRAPGAGGQFHYTPETVGKLLPPPLRVQECPAAQAQIWLYQGQELHQAMQAKAAAWRQAHNR
jgi:hypothetical protein